MSRTHFPSGPKGLFILFSAVFLLAGCAPKEDITKRALLNKPPNYLLARIQDPIGDLQWYSAKAATEVVQNGKENSFKSSFKLRRDSLVWASLSPALGIEIVRVVVSNDSVKFINKLNDEFFIGAMQDLSEKVKTEVSFDQLQGLLLGLALEFDPEEKFKSSVEGYRYVLTSNSKKKYVKATEQKDIILDTNESYLPSLTDKRREKLMDKDEEKLVVRKYYISPETFLITELQIFDLGHENLIEILYSEHEKIDGALLPHKIEFHASDGSNTLDVEMQLTRIRVDQPQTMPFRIPEKYERIY